MDYTVTTHDSMGYINLHNYSGVSVKELIKEYGGKTWLLSYTGSPDSIYNMVVKFQTILSDMANRQITKYNTLSDEELDDTFPLGILMVRSLIAQLQTINWISEAELDILSLQQWEHSFTELIQQHIPDWEV